MNHQNHNHSISCASGAALLYLIGDYIALVLAGILSLAIRNLLITYTTYHIDPIYQYFWVPLVYMAFILYEGLYGKRMLIYQMMKKLFRASLGGTVFSIILMFLAQVAGDVSRFYVILYTAISFALLCFIRVILSKWMKKSEAFQIPVLIVGAGKTGEVMARQIQNDTGMRYRIVGFLEDHEPYDKTCNILGGFTDMERVIRETGVQYVIIAAPGIPQTQLSALIYQAQTLVRNVGVVPNLVAVPMSNVTAESFFDAKIMVLRINNNLAMRRNRIFKYVIELFMTMVGIVLISPLLIWLAYKIHKDSEGPIIYSGVRVGQNGREFKCFKFRSMYMNSDEILKKYLNEHPEKREEWEVYHKLKGYDPRVTPIGETIRRLSLDELPQIFNVVRGEMGLVGPRPYLPQEVKDMGEARDTILLVKPGITGYWQTSGRNEITFEERLHMESWYVCNWDVWIDFMLLWRTIKVVFNHKGAY